MAIEAPSAHRWTPVDLSAEAFSAAQVRVAILLPAQASLASVAAVLEDLRAVTLMDDVDGAPPRFATRLTGETPGQRLMFAGASISPHAPLDDVVYDAVVVPTLLDDGCLSNPDYGPVLSEAERGWLRRQHASGAVFSTMCSGVLALADAGMLSGRKAAYIPLYADAFRARFPDVEIQTNRTLVVSGDRREFITGGGSIYSTDVSLFNIARFFGPALALDYARLYNKSWTEAFHGAAEIDPHSAAIDDRVVALAKRFFVNHLASPGLVGGAAELANMSVRTFCRRFQKATGMAPRDYIAAMRTERARELLSSSRTPIDEIAAKLGYADRSSFAKAFRAHEGVPPATYRTRFQGAARL